MSSQVLLDTNFIYELNNPKTSYRQQLLAFASLEKRERLLPDVALTEICYLLRARLDISAVVRFLNSLTSTKLVLVPLTIEDSQRAAAIMSEYEDSKLDFVDCCIMAISERLNITTVYTFDQRDFTIFRPKHCEFLELLP